MEMQDLLNGRCGWCGTDSLYVKYHDEEWGRLVTDDRLLFEFLTLESAQAGLSWITILRKRERYRKAFYDFDVNKVAQMTEQDVERLMQDEGIVRPAQDQIGYQQCQTFQRHSERVWQLLQLHIIIFPRTKTDQLPTQNAQGYPSLYS